jgi:hypothetical protein
MMCHVQTDMSLTRCDYKTKEHGMSDSDVSCSNRDVTYPLWLTNKRAWNVRQWFATFTRHVTYPLWFENNRAWNFSTWCAMLKENCHLPPVITKQKSMECQKVMCHVQTDMSLTTCDNPTTENRAWEYISTALLWHNKSYTLLLFRRLALHPLALEFMADLPTIIQSKPLCQCET